MGSASSTRSSADADDIQSTQAFDAQIAQQAAEDERIHIAHRRRLSLPTIDEQNSKPLSSSSNDTAIPINLNMLTKSTKSQTVGSGGGLTRLEAESKGAMRHAFHTKTGVIPPDPNAHHVKHKSSSSSSSSSKKNKSTQSQEATSQLHQNQDRWFIQYALGDDVSSSLFGVIDGHGEQGAACAQYIQRQLPSELARRVAQITQLDDTTSSQAAQVAAATAQSNASANALIRPAEQAIIDACEAIQSDLTPVDDVSAASFDLHGSSRPQTSGGGANKRPVTASSTTTHRAPPPVDCSFSGASACFAVLVRSEPTDDERQAYANEQHAKRQQQQQQQQSQSKDESKDDDEKSTTATTQNDALNASSSAAVDPATIASPSVASVAEGASRPIGQQSSLTDIPPMPYKRHLLVSNIGNSRCILCRQLASTSQLIAIQLSVEQIPLRHVESSRILALGGRICPLNGSVGEDCGPLRVWLSTVDVPGILTSRSFGDSIVKSIGVIVTPEIQRHLILENDIFAILVTDGVTQWLTNEQITSIVWKYKHDLYEAAQQVTHEAAKQWRKEEAIVDDCTIVIIQLNPAQ